MDDPAAKGKEKVAVRLLRGKSREGSWLKREYKG